MPSANEFVDAALRLIGVIDAVENASAEDAETGFDVLNSWIDSLGVQRQTIYRLLRTTQALTGGTATYTIGTGGTINIARPVWIDSAALIIDPSATFPTETPITVLQDDAYSAWPQKTYQSTYAGAIWFDHNWSAGLGLIYPLPIPSASGTSLAIYTPVALTEFADQSTNYTFPPGYRRAIRLNLAMELSAHYPGATPPQNLEKLATDSMANLKRGNLRLSHVVIDPALTRQRGTLSRMRFTAGEF